MVECSLSREAVATGTDRVMAHGVRATNPRAAMRLSKAADRAPHEEQAAVTRPMTSSTRVGFDFCAADEQVLARRVDWRLGHMTEPGTVDPEPMHVQHHGCGGDRQPRHRDRREQLTPLVHKFQEPGVGNVAE
jgi:hypothetical protein